MTISTQGPETPGASIPLLVNQALRAVERWKPDTGRQLRGYILKLLSGEASANRVQLLPSTVAFVAQAAARGARLDAGRNPTQKCRRCEEYALVLLVGGLPVAFYDTCQKHAQEGDVSPARASAADSAASY